MSDIEVVSDAGYDAWFLGMSELDGEDEICFGTQMDILGCDEGG